jgi:flagellar basal body-associated protein FliL
MGLLQSYLQEQNTNNNNGEIVNEINVGQPAAGDIREIIILLYIIVFFRLYDSGVFFFMWNKKRIQQKKNVAKQPKPIVWY